MKKNCWLMLGAMLTTGVLAQQTTNPPAAAPTPAPARVTPAPAAKPVAKSKAKPAVAKPAPKKLSPAHELRSIPLVAGPATVIASNVNVRGRSGLISEVLTKVQKGEAVMVLEEITLQHSKEDEPSAWAKIVLPATTHVWVNSSFLDPATKTVKPKKLNLRGGPGENYSVLGTLERGATVKEVSVKGDWTELEAPADAFAFVAAQYLKQEATMIAASTPKPDQPAPAPTVIAAGTPKPVEPAPVPTPAPVPAPTPAPVTEPPAAAETTTEPATPAPAPEPTVTTTEPLPAPASEPAVVEPEMEEPPPIRIVEHEGIVKAARSIAAPTQFELVNPDTTKTINYLYSPSTNLDLRRYKGMRIVVTGEEGLEERWRNTPVITIERIVVVE